MPRNIGPNDLLIEDIKLELLHAIEDSARASGRTTEDEALVLLERGFATLQAKDAAEK